MIFLLSEKVSSRLRYSCDFIFRKVLGIPYQFITDIPLHIDQHQVIINYTTKVDAGLQILPSGLMEETGVNPQCVSVSDYNGAAVIFYSGKGDFPFDIFSMVFYFLSRYEEYSDFKPDQHGRFPASESLAHKHGFLQVPVVDRAIRVFGYWLKKNNSHIEIKSPHFDYHSTIDIDNAYAVKGKSLGRVLGGALKSFFKLNFSSVAQRFAVYFGNQPDPFDAYDFQIKLAEEFKVPLTYFVLYTQNGKFDRSLTPGNKTFERLIDQLVKRSVVGVHPSYDSCENHVALKQQIEFLGRNRGKIIRSRQHFLRMRFPQTPKQLLKLGIESDYSMGFATHNGFRAGTAYSFPFYDFTDEKITGLIFIPFQIMDSVFYDQKGESALTAWNEIVKIADTIRETGGTFVSVWHDRAFDEKSYSGWKACYQKLHQYCGNDSLS